MLGKERNECEKCRYNVRQITYERMYGIIRKVAGTDIREIADIKD